MITLKTRPGEKVLELGGGSTPRIRPNCDVRPGPNVDIVADFNDRLPFSDDEFDGIFSSFAIEHVSWVNVPKFLSDIFRLLKPGGTFICILPNTQAQMGWIINNPNGWDDKGPFEACSEVLYGSQDYPENSHKAYFSPGVVDILFRGAGFTDLEILPYGERHTDLCVRAIKPAHPMNGLGQHVDEVEVKDRARLPSISLTDRGPQGILDNEEARRMFEQAGGMVEGKHFVSHGVIQQSLVTGRFMDTTEERKRVFNKFYFNPSDRSKYGGYKGTGYADFPVHHLTAQHVLRAGPRSVLEIGCARGHIVKRLQDAGVRAEGMEISRHCWMTRAADPIKQWDMCEFPWPYRDREFDLNFSCAVLEHVPEQFLPRVIQEMARTCERGLHGIDFGEKDDGNDKSHVSLHPKGWWDKVFREYAPGWPVVVVNKEELEQGQYTKEVLAGDGKVKVNVGSHMQMFHYGWQNIDIIPDLAPWAQANGYNYRVHDVKQGMPFGTAAVDLLFASHFLEHLTYAEGLAFLKECRRVIRPDGCMRLAVPDAAKLCQAYGNVNNDGTWDLSEYNEINDECEKAKTQASKLHALLYGGDHKSIYDEETLITTLSEAGFSAKRVGFREGHQQIRTECVDMFVCLSLYVEAVPCEF